MNQAKRYNQDKPDLHYLHVWYDALAEVARVCTQGAEKYERGNYLLGQPYSQLLGCAERHIAKFGDYRRPDNDPESGRHHIAHAIWNLLQLLQHDMGPNADLARNSWDDRLRPPRNACREVWESLQPLRDGGGFIPTRRPSVFGASDDDSRDPADYEQETADLEAAAAGTGRGRPQLWEEALEAWCTGDPDSHGYPPHVIEPWDPNEHQIEVTHLNSTEREFIPGTPENRERIKQAHIRAKL